MIPHHHISKLLIDERVSELHNAAAGQPRVKPVRARPRRRRFGLPRRRVAEPISPSPS